MVIQFDLFPRQFFGNSSYGVCLQCQYANLKQFQNELKKLIAEIDTKLVMQDEPR